MDFVLVDNADYDFLKLIQLIDWDDMRLPFESKIIIEESGPKLITQNGDNIYFIISGWNFPRDFPKIKEQHIGILTMIKSKEMLIFTIESLAKIRHNGYSMMIDINKIEYYFFDDEQNEHHVWL